MSATGLIRAHLMESRLDAERIADACGSHTDPGHLALMTTAHLTAALELLDLVEKDLRTLEFIRARANEAPTD